MKPFFPRNIDNRGRLVRGLGALGFFWCAWFAIGVSPWLGVSLMISGGFVLFEAVRGWCVLRACGIKTKLWAMTYLWKNGEAWRIAIRFLAGRNPRKTLIRSLLLVAGSYLLLGYVVTPIRVTGISMVPNYPDGSLKAVFRLAYLLEQPRRGDVVLVERPYDEGRSRAKITWLFWLVILPAFFVAQPLQIPMDMRLAIRPSSFAH
jgi:hypothetical protein